MLPLTRVAIVAAAFATSCAAAPIASEENVDNRYIITLKPSVQSLDNHLSWVNDIQSRQVATRDLAGVQRSFAGSFTAQRYAGEFDDETIEQIKNNPDVEHVEKDQIWYADVIDLQPLPAASLKQRDVVTQEDAFSGLGSISHRQNGSTDYIYDTVAGEGTFAYVVATGVSATHSEFGDRVTLAWSAFGDNHEDGYGLGTHNAGVIAGATYGVSKQASIQSVKVISGTSGTTAVVMQGFSWAAEDIISKGRQDTAVISISLTGSYSETFNKLIDDAAAQGVVTVVSAGNGRVDASTISPASAAKAITVGGIDDAWNFWVYANSAVAGSNWGSAVDINAPASNVRSSWVGSDTQAASVSGTTTGSSYVAGLVLYARSVDGIVGFDALIEYILKVGTADAITGDLRGTVNIIANNNNPQQ